MPQESLSQTLEARVAVLEKAVAELTDQIAKAKKDETDRYDAYFPRND